MARLLVVCTSYLSRSALTLSLLEDSGPSADTLTRSDALALSLLLSLTPSTYVYTSFASDLVLAKSVALAKRDGISSHRLKQLRHN